MEPSLFWVRLWRLSVKGDLIYGGLEFYERAASFYLFGVKKCGLVCSRSDMTQDIRLLLLDGLCFFFRSGNGPKLPKMIVWGVKVDPDPVV